MLKYIKEDNNYYILNNENEKICKMIGTEFDQSW